MAFEQIKVKKDAPRKFVVGQTQKAKPLRLPITVMSSHDKLEMNRRRVGSRHIAKGVRPYNAPAYTAPVSPR